MPNGPLLVTLSVLLLLVDTTNAQSRVFTTCEAIADGLDSSAVSNHSASVRAFCRQAEVLFEGAFSSTIEEEPQTVRVDGQVLDIGSIHSEAGIAVTTSSSGGVPFTVIGGDEELSTSGAERGISTRASSGRPIGPWFTIVAVDVRSKVSTVWTEISDLEAFLTLGLHRLGATTSSNSDTVTVKLNSGGKVVFEEESRSDDDRFIVIRLKKVSAKVYPGFKFDGSRIYVQALSKGFIRRSTNIEVGWGPPESFDVGGNLSIGVRLMESLLLEILANLEGRFGRRCEFGRNVRTVEGDCNSLDDPARGSAGSPLLRFGHGVDPAYPEGDRSIPAGPLDVNVRDLSNALFATSPGAAILQERAEALGRTCVTRETSDGSKYEVCPFRFIHKTSNIGESSVIPFHELVFNDHEELVFHFCSRTCDVEILLKCSGETFLDIADDPCGAQTNRLYDRAGCVITPGQDSVLANSAGLTDLFFTFGQFVDHDFGLSPLSQISREQPGFSKLSRPAEVVDDFPIVVPDDDFHFFDREELEFTRARFSEDETGSHVNLHSSYLDGSQIYGADFLRARLLRSFEGGKLDLSRNNMPPFNRVSGPGALGAVVDNAPNTEGRFFVVGDARGNEQLLLLSLHIVFLREHNLVAEELAAKFPEYDDEILYQTARAIVLAEYQCIIYNEWLPLLLGRNSPSVKDFVYDAEVDSTVSAIFTTAAFRFGHSLVGSNLLQLGPGKRRSADMKLLPVRDVYFKPEIISEQGIDSFLRGGAWHLCKEMDHRVVDDLRNFLISDFPVNVTEPPRFDLVAINLQRGRDMGLPSFNSIRELYGLRRYTDFTNFIKDPNLADLAKMMYKGDVDLVDAFFGGLVEEHVDDSQLGETFTTIIAEQFRRSRDGDRFFYTGIEFDEKLIRAMPRLQKIAKHDVKLGDIIRRTTQIKKSELGKKASVFQL